MASPIITFTTDFGLTDHYVGVMKGVAMGLCPEARCVDITHGIPPFAILEGAYEIAQAYRYFPAGTIHVVVVDPGVGTARRPLLVEAASQFFLAPDNGVLSLLFKREVYRARHLTADSFFLHPVSHTFHGRDIFAPVAGHLARGVPSAQLGPVISDPQKLSSVSPQQKDEKTWHGLVWKADRFGNLITTFQSSEFSHLLQSDFTLTVGNQTLHTLSRTFAETPAGELALLTGSGGYLEVAINQGSAAQQLGCVSSSPVTLTQGLTL